MRNGEFYGPRLRAAEGYRQSRATTSLLSHVDRLVVKTGSSEVKQFFIPLNTTYSEREIDMFYI